MEEVMTQVLLPEEEQQQRGDVAVDEQLTLPQLLEEPMVQMPRRKIWKWVMGSVALLILLAVAALVLVFRVNQFSLVISMAGEREMILEYGKEYVEPGAEVLLKGSLFWKDGFKPEDLGLDIYSQINEALPGKYTVRYTAQYYGLLAEESRLVQIIDMENPVIILTPGPEETILPGTPYEEPGYQALDNVDGDITDKVIRTEDLGIITYAVVDSSGNPAYAEREIPYYDPLPPEIHLEGGTEYSIPVGTVFEEPGFTATDNADGDITDRVIIDGVVDCFSSGVYPITYTVLDTFQNETVVTRNVSVVAMPRPETVYPQKKTIYLTFDDGPGPYTEELLDVLDSYGVKATFFVVDSGYNTAMRQIVNRGHSIGIHSITHDYETIYASPEAYFSDLLGMQQRIYDITGVKTTLMRFPGGGSNTISRDLHEGLMTLLTEAVQDAGFQYFDWNVDSNDAGGARKSKTVLANVIDGVSQQRVSVVLQHDIHDYSVEAVEDIIIWGLNNGYQFLPLTENSPGMHHGVNN